MNMLIFFVASRGVVANKKAVGGPYNDVIVYVMVIRMTFTLTDQHRIASFGCRRWYSPFTYFRWKMSSGYSGIISMPSITYCHDAHFLWRVESKPNGSRIAIIIAVLVTPLEVYIFAYPCILLLGIFARVQYYTAEWNRAVSKSIFFGTHTLLPCVSQAIDLTRSSVRRRLFRQHTAPYVWPWKISKRQQIRAWQAKTSSTRKCERCWRRYAVGAFTSPVKRRQQGRNQTSIQEEANLPSPLPHLLFPPLLLLLLSFPILPLPYSSLPSPPFPFLSPFLDPLPFH